MRFANLFFDLDDTLYPSNTGLWDAIRDRMNRYMQKIIDKPVDEIAVIRQGYLERYGTTLRGLQENYDIDAIDYLAYVHDLPLDQFIQPDPELKKLLVSLPQNRWILTNADCNHANRVLKILGLEGCFDAIIDIVALNFACKPDRLAYQRALAVTGVSDPYGCIIFDDSVRNLAPAHDLGFYTVLVSKKNNETGADRAISSLHELPDSMPELWNHNAQ